MAGFRKKTKKQNIELGHVIAEVEGTAVDVEQPESNHQIDAIRETPVYDAILEWTVRNIAADPANVKLDSPNAAAYRQYLSFAQAEPKVFWSEYSRLQQRKNAAIAEKAAFEDDKRKYFRLFDLLLEEYEARLAKESSQESAELPASDQNLNSATLGS